MRASDGPQDHWLKTRCSRRNIELFRAAATNAGESMAGWVRRILYERAGAMLTSYRLARRGELVEAGHSEESAAQIATREFYDGESVGWLAERRLEWDSEGRLE